MLRSSIVPLGIALASSLVAHAQFSPLVLTPESYTYDVIVEKEARRIAPATTASLDGGTNNTGATFYERGFNINFPETGLLAAGEVVVSEAAADHTYAMAASYTTNNAVLVDSGVTNATLTVTTATPLTALSFLATSGGGASTNNYRITHADNSVETGTLIAPDWFNGANPAFNANGRVVVANRTFQNVNEATPNPRLYSIDVTLTNNTSPVTKIELERVGGGRMGIFAISASTGGEFAPLEFTGFNKDMIVEATADQAGPLQGVTTASIDNGAANTAWTAYEQGHNLLFPTTGLPAAGTLLTNVSATNNTYRMAPDYTQNNAIVIDSANGTATITPAAPAVAAGISFLGASGNGAVTVAYTINHQTGDPSSGTFVIPDWFNGNPVAFFFRGRVNLNDTTYGNVNDATNPRLYPINIVDNSGAPITSIDLSWTSGTGHGVIFAVSTSGAPQPPTFLSQPVSINIAEGGSGSFTGNVSATPPVNYQWQVGTNNVYVNLTNGANVSGANAITLTLNNATPSIAADYILIASNAAGSATSRVSRVNIVSTKTDVTTTSDTITMLNGSTPANEVVANAINDNTTKYLNYGPDGNTAAPFAGPTGLIVTLGNGSAVVTGLRVYTANDGTERDPIDYKLEGSNDEGATFNTIASGPLNLPLERNGAGLNLDPLTLVNQEVRFDNSAGYTTYRLTFNNVRNNTTANSMQIGEIELLGEYGIGAPELSISRATDGTITITTSQPGTLESTDDLNAPIIWDPEGAIDTTRTFNATGTQRFFRVVQTPQ